jgi:hypothetical protein
MEIVEPIQWLRAGKCGRCTLSTEEAQATLPMGELAHA